VKELSGHAGAGTQAALENCLALVGSVEAYPSWYSEVVKSVDVLERDADGAATTVRTRLHLSQGPLSRDFELIMAVDRQGNNVRLTRVPDDSGDGERFEVRWTLNDHRIVLDLEARLDVPRFLPIGGIGDSVAQGFVSAAVRALGA
jgi:hypothetical protein